MQEDQSDFEYSLLYFLEENLEADGAYEKTDIEMAIAECAGVSHDIDVTFSDIKSEGKINLHVDI